MKLQLTIIDDDHIPVERDDPVIPVVDTNGKLLGNLTWVQRYVGRSEIPLPHQVLLSFRGPAKQSECSTTSGPRAFSDHSRG
jgi:hypothetical protein